MDNKKEKKQEVIKVTEFKEEQNVEEQKKPVLTLKERIKKLINDLTKHSEIDDLTLPDKAKEILEKDIFALIQRVLHPEQFCPECDERLFFNSENSTFECPNCGFKGTVAIQNINTKSTITPRGVIPPQVEKAIKQSEEDMKDIPLPRPKTALGDKIRKLVADRDTGNTGGPTQEDESKVKGADKNVSNKINWV